MITKLIFYNNHNNGDIHFTREFVRDIIKKTNYDEYYFLHKRSPKLLMDIPNLKHGILNEYCKVDSPYHVINNETYVNTHLGVYQIFVDKVINVDLPIFYDYFQVIFNKLRIPMENKKSYLPVIDYNVFEINGIKEYLDKNRNAIKVIVCNGSVHSNQSLIVDFKDLVEKLSNEFPHIHFLLTDKKDVIEKDNVLYTSDIIKAGSDLNEISYLSTFCGAIIGRASGPYSFTEVKENLNDVDKTFIFICNNFTDGAWYDQTLSSKVWINNYDANNIHQTINRELKKLNNYSNLIDVISKDDNVIITPLEDIQPKIRTDFYRDKDLWYQYSGTYTNKVFHWVKPHGHYHTGMEIKCKFYNDETNDYLFQKII